MLLQQVTVLTSNRFYAQRFDVQDLSDEVRWYNFLPPNPRGNMAEASIGSGTVYTVLGDVAARLFTLGRPLVKEYLPLSVAILPKRATQRK